jgi:multidrug efflux pump subunit AcrB
VKSEHERDQEVVATKRNTARYFTENRQVAWVALVATLAWGLYAYLGMPKRKDPHIQVRQAVASCLWPGASAERVEQLVTRKIEQRIAENSRVEKIESISRSSISIVYVTLNEGAADVAKEFDDIKGRLDGLRDLPEGAGPVQFIKDFGDTAALMLTVASPPTSDIELELRAAAIARAIEAARRGAPSPEGRATLLVAFPPAMNSLELKRIAAEAVAATRTLGTDPRLIEGPGFLGIDTATTLDDGPLLEGMLRFSSGRLRLSELHPDLWRPAVVRDPKTTLTRLKAVAGPRYSHRQLDDYTDTLQRYLQSVPAVSKVQRTGQLAEQVTLAYSQERLSSYGLPTAHLAQLLGARNITAPGGVVEIGEKNVILDPSGEFHSADEIGGVIVAASPSGVPLYLRDLVEIGREYQNPPRFENFLLTRDGDGSFRRDRAVTISIQMRPGEQIADFGVAVDRQLALARTLLPEDLVIRRTSDQPLQVQENVSLFMNSLYEAILLVVLVALIGFWEWRTALLLAVSIPLTLAMTFGLMHVFGIDIQQISIASLILALGLLVDDPVVAADAIKRSMGQGWPRVVAAWLGPTKLAAAIMFATVTNICAYLPLLTLPGDVGKFIYSLPVVLTLSLVASRLVSMSFVPLLGYALMRPAAAREPTNQERRERGFGRQYSRVVGWAIDHRLLFLGGALALFALGAVVSRQVRPAFFPIDRQNLFYADVWLPEDAPLAATRSRAQEASQVIQEVAQRFGEEHGARDGKPKRVLESITEFVGGGGPRFWFSVSPEQPQLNYAQLVVQVSDKEDTAEVLALAQRAVAARVAGARVDLRPLETGKPVGIPVAYRISGEDIGTLRGLAEQLKAALRAVPNAERVRDDWGADTFSVDLKVDPDRANLAGVTNLDVAVSAATAMNGQAVGLMREGDRQIPIVARLRADERAQLGDVQNLYVAAGQGGARVPLRQVSGLSYGLKTEKLLRRNQFRTITVSAFPVEGALPGEVVKLAAPRIEELRRRVPAGYAITVGGAEEEQGKSFGSLAVVLVISLFAIFLSLVVQFKSAVKPLIVFAALPFGAVAALVSLAIMGAPFSFMAFLGVISLMGVIVSHVIVLFDFIEEMREHGEPLREALIDAGIVRLRPVLITVGATVLGLVPLALHGGPLWEPLCYVQIGGLTVATALTLLLVPVLYTVVVVDLGWIEWKPPEDAAS